MKRGMPLVGSRPTVHSSMPKKALTRPLAMDLPEMATITERPKTASMNISPSAEVHGHIRNDRGEEGHNQRADDAADEGREHGDGKRLARLTLLAHRVAVQQRGRRGRGARRVNQDGGNRAAVHAAAVDAQQQADGRNQIHAEGEGDQQRHAHRGGSCPESHRAERRPARRGRSSEAPEHCQRRRRSC